MENDGEIELPLHLIDAPPLQGRAGLHGGHGDHHLRGLVDVERLVDRSAGRGSREAGGGQRGGAERGVDVETALHPRGQVRVEHA